MTYPNQIDQFSVKLNKKMDGSAYVIEEQLPIVEGKFEGLLAHDNITNTSIRVYTGSKLTGEEITNYIVSVPSETPWRRYIKVFASVVKVYVTYETPGDTVEADDLNVLQQSMTATQEEVERYKAENDEAVEQIDNRMTSHVANKQNPHGVTVTQIGAETPAGAQTKADAAQNAAISAAAQDATTKSNAAQVNAIAAAALDATTKANTVQISVDTHTANKNNPHAVTVAQIGAETPASAQAKADAAKTAAISAAASDATGKANVVQGNLNTHAANTNDAHDVANRLQALKTVMANYIDQSIAAIVDGAPEMLDTLYELSNALGNDPNFSATMTNLIGQKLPSSEVVTVAAANKVLRLNASSLLPASITGAATSVPWSGVTGKPSTYTPATHGHEASEITQSTNYRFVSDDNIAAWEAKSSLLLGESSTTAYRGDRGKTAYDHSQTAHAPSNANYYVHPDSGVTAGTYRSVTVNAQGHISVGANPTTLAGYGITDGVKTTDIATQAEATAGTDNSKYMTPLRVKQAIAANPLAGSLTWNQLKGV